MSIIEDVRALTSLQLAIEDLRRARGTTKEQEAKQLVEELFKELFGPEIEVII